MLLTIDLSILIRLSIAMIKHHDRKELGEGRVYFTLQLSGHISLLRKTGQELKQDKKLKERADLETLEEFCLLA